jgi:NAD(P)H dehydrogenase (quinone)
LKHAIILAHPNARSFAGAVADTYTRACHVLGHQVIGRDLYHIGFDPCLKTSEMPFADGFSPEPDVLAERALLRDCDVFAFVYPLWLNSPPAILKGYLERVFGFGFAYGAGGHSFTPLLSGRKMISFSSSGAPSDWLQKTGGLDAIRTLFDAYFAALTGLEFIEHIHVGGVRPGASESFVGARLKDVETCVARHFGRQRSH